MEKLGFIDIVSCFVFCYVSHGKIFETIVKKSDGIIKLFRTFLLHDHTDQL